MFSIIREENAGVCKKFDKFDKFINQKKEKNLQQKDTIQRMCRQNPLLIIFFISIIYEYKSIYLSMTMTIICFHISLYTHSHSILT